MAGEDETFKPEKNELTRRQWILQLGGAAIVIGFRGVAGEMEGAAGAESAASKLAALPPGLYEPSNDHLSHALTRDSRFRPIPPGAETDYVRPRSGPFEPRAFSSEEFSKIGRVVELILGEPRGASVPSATGNAQGESVVAEVAEWIDHVAFHAIGVREAIRTMVPEHRILAVRAFGQAHVEKLETADPQKVCREGLDWLENESKQRYSKTFESLGDEEQTDLLRRVSDDRPGRSGDNAGTLFFDWIKAEIIRGFYTSQAGLKELDYRGNAFYVVAPGCTGHEHMEESAE